MCRYNVDIGAHVVVDIVGDEIVVIGVELDANVYV